MDQCQLWVMPERWNSLEPVSLLTSHPNNVPRWHQVSSSLRAKFRGTGWCHWPHWGCWLYALSLTPTEKSTTIIMALLTARLLLVQCSGQLWGSTYQILTDRTPAGSGQSQVRTKKKKKTCSGKWSTDKTDIGTYMAVLLRRNALSCQRANENRGVGGAA